MANLREQDDVSKPIRPYFVDAPFRGSCCWPGCDADSTTAVEAPMCGRHLMRVWRIVNDAGSTVLAAAMQSDRRTPPDPREGSVYFVRFGDRVKIGFSTDVRTRLVAIPHDEVLAVVPGTIRDEKRCHAAFADLRLTGEWFTAAPRLLDFAAALAGTDQTGAA